MLSHRNAVRLLGYVEGGSLSNDEQQKISNTALPIINDVILEGAVKAGLPVIDLKVIFDDVADYANEIEPSAVGGMKMAKIIKEIACEYDFSTGKTVIYN